MEEVVEAQNIRTISRGKITEVTRDYVDEVPCNTEEYDL